MICVDKAVEKLAMNKADCRTVIQGFGNVGSMAADLMSKAGYKIVGLADIGGGLYNENGFDIPKVIDWVTSQKKPLQELPGGGTKMSSRDVLFQPCEVLIPAAIENQITEKTYKPRFCAKAPTAQRPGKPMPFWTAKACSPCRTFWATPAE
jgi:glutamate dehydrogenase/leucine dehydrogenase